MPAEWTAPTPPEGFAPVAAGRHRGPALPQPGPIEPALTGPATLEPALSDPATPDPPPYLDLSTVALLGQPKRAPSQGWRKWLYLASFKLINVGESPKVIHLNSLVAQVQRPLRGCYRIALLSLKGGVG